MTQKRILRANSRKVVRERDLLIRDVFLKHANDPDDPEVPTLIDQLVDGDPGATAFAFFDIANRLIDDLAETTGNSPQVVLGRALRG